MNVQVRNAFRANTIVGMTVRGRDGKRLGRIEDVVIDMESQAVAYYALSHGSVLGFGGKLFAVPPRDLELKHDEDDIYFLLDTKREKLAEAPGFSKEQWPDCCHDDFRAQLDQHYEGQKQLEHHAGQPTA